MKQSEIFAYLYDFISMLMDKKESKEYIENIILFGSVARGDFDKESDIDLFIEIKDLSNKLIVEKIVRETIDRFEVHAEKTWRLRLIDLPIKPIVGKLSEEVWEDLHDEIKKYGVNLYGKYSATMPNLKHYSLVSYSLNKLKQNKKVNLLRKLFGYRIKKKNKIYEQKGMLSSLEGIKLMANQILIKANDLKKIADIFKSFKVTYTVRDVWIN
ncbi:nucleotidyltransferase domain-containing protein [Candidatus Woesearchaeota archaeon]|nr:nucleotidyltransferase domain-containing protein [Candidatus Woesearchaeota archaeon]